jgi:hypothetical protein
MGPVSAKVLSVLMLGLCKFSCPYTEEKVITNRPSLIAVFLLAVIGIPSISFAEAEYNRREALIVSYLKRAFAYDENAKLRKFDIQGAIPISFECRATVRENCAKSLISANDAIRETKNLKFDESFFPKLRIVFADRQKAEIVKQEFASSYVDGLVDVSDPDCLVFTSQQGSTITNAAIVLSVDQFALRQKICLTIQLSQALGLSSPGKLGFSEIWKSEQDGYENMTHEKFLELRQTSTMLNSIHMCPSMMPGMKVIDVIRLLEQENNICMQDMKVL